MKILMLTSGTPNSRMTHRIVALGRELVRRGHDVSLVAPRLDRHSGWQLDMPETMDGVRMIYPYQFRTKSYLLNLLPYIFSVSFTVLGQKADLIYLYKPTPATIPALLAKWFKRTPIVLDMDDLGSEVMQIEGQPAVMWKLVAVCERIAAQSANAIVAVSRLLMNEYASRYPEKPLLRLPNGVDPAEFIPVTPARKRKPRIIFFGILNRTRIVAPLLAALPEVIASVGSDQVEVEILGDGLQRKELEAISMRLGLTDNVHFRGWTRFEELSDYAASGDIAICVMPDERTTAACSNQKVFQYQALELATIVSRVGDLPLYVEDGKAGVIVAPEDPKELAAAIVALLSDRAKRRSVTTRGRELAVGTYSWSRLAHQLEAFMESVK
jgi:glycosyltransferase involved in cell wall biosynthesis